MESWLKASAGTGVAMVAGFLVDFSRPATVVASAAAAVAGVALVADGLHDADWWPW